MSGIYLFCSQKNPAPETPGTRLRPMIDRAAVLPQSICELWEESRFAGAVIHRGQQRSCGSAWDPETQQRVISIGSCWLTDSSTSLAEPGEILSQTRSISLRSPWPLCGYYLVAIYDAPRNRIVVQNDRFGVYPFYYRTDGDDLFFAASEIKALTVSGADKPNPEGIAEFLKLGHISTEATFLNSVRRLPPNHKLVFENGRIDVFPLPPPSFKRHRPFSDTLMHDLTERFDASFKRFSSETDTFSAFMSGGLDSRMCVAAAQKAGFWVKAACMGENKGLECQVAREFGLTQGIETLVHEYDGRHFTDWFPRGVWITEGRCPPAHMHYIDGLEAGNYHPQLQLNGLIAGAIIGGDYEKPDLTLKTQPDAMAYCRSLMQPIYWPTGAMAQTFSLELIRHAKDCAERVSEGLFKRVNFDDGYAGYLWFRFNYRALGLIVNCIGSQAIPWTDPVLPFLDPAFFELCTEVDRSTLYDRKLQLEWASRFYPEVKCIPRVKDGTLVPLDHIDLDAYRRAYEKLQRRNLWKYRLGRISRGRINLPQTETFPYYDQWYRRWPHIRSFFKQMLLCPQSLDRGLWKRKGIKRLLNDLRIGRNVWGAAAGILLVEIFLRQFSDGESPPCRPLVPSLHG